MNAATRQVIATKLADVARDRGHSIRAVVLGGVEIAAGADVLRLQVTDRGVVFSRSGVEKATLPAGLTYRGIVGWVECWCSRDALGY